MSKVADELMAALRERFAIIADDLSRRAPKRHLQRLKEISERIADLQSRLPKPVDPQLAHFLQRASYSKALAFLEAHLEQPR